MLRIFFLRRILLPYVALASVMLFGTSCAYQKIAKAKDHNYKLQKANEYYDKGKYEKAQLLYYDLAPLYKASEKYEFIAYRYAQCSYMLKDYQTSQMMFKDYLTNFPTSDKNEEVEFLQAKSYFLEAQSGTYALDASSIYKAMGYFQVFLQNHEGTSRYNEIMDMIAQCRARLETKDLRAAEQYMSMEHYNAAGIYFSALSTKYSESARADEYKYNAIRAFYDYAKHSIAARRKERYEKVIKEYEEFVNRYPESKYLVKANVLHNIALSEMANKKLPNY